MKTKVHTPKSPSAQFSVSERYKLFLEVHIQNLTQDPLYLHQARLEPVEGWQVHLDVNSPPNQAANVEDNKEHPLANQLFSGSMSLVQPQDTRQYIYVLAPTSSKDGKNESLYYPSPVPGSVIPLGRLDISWRSAMGEPGRLLTSVS